MFKRELKELKTNTNKIIVVSVYYDKGGYNYFSGTRDERGYWLSATPEERSESMRVVGAFTGIKKFILGTARFSQKTLDGLNPSDSEIQELVNHVCVKNKLEVR